MENKYEAVMNRVELSPESRQRILRNLQKEPEKRPVRPVLRLLPMAACLVLVIGIAAAFLLPGRKEPVMPQTQITNGIAEAASAEELSDMVGFPVKNPPAAAENVSYMSYWGSLAQISWTEGTQSATFRQAPGTEDPSGDYTVYEFRRQEVIAGLTVTLSGCSADACQLAVWTDGEYGYSLYFSQPADEETVKKMISDLN